MTEERQKAGVLRFYGILNKDLGDTFDDKVIYSYTTQAIDLENGLIMVYIEQLNDWYDRSKFKEIENYNAN